MPSLGNMMSPTADQTATLRRFLGGGGRKNPGQAQASVQGDRAGNWRKPKSFRLSKERPTRQENSGYAQLLPPVFRIAETHEQV